MILNLLLLAVGLVLLVKCADIFVDGSSNVAKSLGIPSLIIGLTIVAFGTSAPEAAVSITAALKGSTEISIGNAVGSNVCNSLLILGVCGLITMLKTKDEVRKRDFPYYLLSAFVLLIMTGDYFVRGEEIGYITRANGLVLLCFLAVYIYSLIANVKKSRAEQKEERPKFKIKDVFMILIGIAGIVAGGQFTVNAATEIARALGVSESLIALTIIAIGTSLPELVTSVVACKKGESDLAIGNVIGSDIFNILFILGLTATISPLSLNSQAFIDIIFMSASSLLVFIMLQKKQRISWRKGLCMLAMYGLYMCYITVR